MILSTHEIAWLVASRWPKIEQATAVAVCLAETGVPGGAGADFDALHRSGDSSSTSFGQYDHGGWQISGRWNPQLLQAHPDWRDPATNADMAFAIWQAKGWTAWSTFKSKRYEMFLPDAGWGLKAPFPPPSSPQSSVGPLAERIAALERRFDAMATLVTEVREHFT